MAENSKGAIAKDTVVYMIAKMIEAVVGIVTMSAMSYLFRKAQMGYYSTVNIAVTMIALLAVQWLNQSVLRYINKYDIARLIITVEDTGCGMSIDKVNDILNNNKEFSKEELNNLEKINVGIKLANKLVIEMGGILVIKSEENKGTKVTIIIDERIKEEDYNKIL